MGYVELSDLSGNFVPRDADGVPYDLSTARVKFDAMLGWPHGVPANGAPGWVLATGITGVGPGNDWNAIEVIVHKDVPQAVVAARIPATVDGWPVVVRRSGPIIAL